MPGVRRELTPTVRGDAELLPLDALLTGLGVGITSDARAGAVTLGYSGREVSLFHRKNLASVGGDLRLLSSPCLLEDGGWLVPIDAVPRLLGPLLGQPAEWRAGARVLLLGAVKVPRVQVTTYVSGDAVRVVLDASEKLPFRVEQEAARVAVTMAGDLVEVDFQQERLTGGIVALVQYVGGREHLLQVMPGPRFAQLKASEQDSPPRLVLDFLAKGAHPAEPGAAQAAAPAPPPPRAVAPSGPRTVVIDPGHGGADQGARGPGGVLEKDVTLALARKLRAAIVNGLGLQVFLTRDRDEDVALDQRTAIANNYKADLFISIHANSSRAAGAHGSEVYFLSYQASDDDSRRVAQAEGALPEASAAGGAVPGSDLALILWDMAQAEHLEESSALASRLQEALAEVTGSQGRGVKQAPFVVLVGAAMPAALVEVAFISNPEEEKLLASDAWQNRVTQALMRGIGRFEREIAQRASLPSAVPAAGR
jgi:N-acetylmuramoyl-L-alanine amidase